VAVFGHHPSPIAVKDIRVAWKHHIWPSSIVKSTHQSRLSLLAIDEGVFRPNDLAARADVDKVVFQDSV
jgi:hypothetical protein